MSDAYKAAGVDIDAGEAVVQGIKAAVESTTRKEVLGGLGGFAGLFRLGSYRDPVLVSGTDGVGTKLLIAQALGRHQTIGIDLVAMCVNDIACCGAEPLFFLDYFATGKLAPEVAVQVVEGIADGCRQAGCALIGGETAEMPGMYGPGHYDLAGFAVGVVERDEVLTGDDIVEGDVLVGLESSGLHSNGFSLVRKLIPEPEWEAFADVLLTPTRIYVKDLKGLDAKAFVHITGGGFPENLPRAMPKGLGCQIDTGSWEVPGIFRELQRRGGLTDDDLYRTFNMGIGMVAFMSPDKVPADARVIGRVIAGEGVRL